MRPKVVVRGAGAREGSSPRGNLPAPITSFVGRERQVQDVLRQLGEYRLVTLAGPPGIGKSRLALHVAERADRHAPGGAWLVELAGLADPSLVASAVAGSLGLHPRRQPPIETLLRELRDTAALLVLDNCEHLVEGCARLARALLTACPSLRILTTSRQPLGLTGEAVWRVPPLTPPKPIETAAGPVGRSDPVRAVLRSEAGQLFVERARAARPSFVLTREHAAAVAEVCRRLDGIPLAIELAAARSATLWPRQLADRLDDRFALLTADGATAAPRHQTLRATLDWSHALLLEPERALFRRLAVFAGGFTLEAAEAVAGDGGWGTGLWDGGSAPAPNSQLLSPHDVLDLLARLIDRSLVIAEERAGGPRYRLLDTLRDYALERLWEAGEEPAARRLHQRWYSDLAERGERDFFGPDHKACCDRLEAELDNVRAALAWVREAPPAERRAALPCALRTAAALAYFWDMRGHLGEGRAWLAELLDLAAAWVDEAGPGDLEAARARALTALGYMLFTQGDAESAERLLVDALGRIDAAEDAWDIAWSRVVLAPLALFRGDPDRAENLLAEVLAIARAPDLSTWVGAARFWLGEVARARGDRHHARAHFEDCLAICRATGNVWGLAYPLAALGRLAFMEADYARAAALHREALAVRHRLDDRRGVAFSLAELGPALVAGGEPAAGAVLIGAADAHFERFEVTLILLPDWETQRERAAAAARAALGEASFEAAYGRGRSLALERAVEIALGAAPETAPRPSAGTAPGLTERQREIAALVAEGRTNREIAAALVISERTAEWHVANIRGTLGLRSRAQLARWAAEHGLAGGWES